MLINLNKNKPTMVFPVDLEAQNDNCGLAAAAGLADGQASPDNHLERINPKPLWGDFIPPSWRPWEEKCD